MRLIDADALLKHETEADRMGAMLVVGKGYILDAPEVDAVPMVRCKECKHNGTWQCHMEYDEYHPEADIHHEMHGDDDFCSYGVKEEGATMTDSEALECFESDCETCQFKGRDCKSCRTKVAISALRREIKN